ncbi:MAG: hypothetical protein HKN68_20485 [Saprospiraceae bacterium]|nr:hypothetical protein [Saprospiraceae bacterium]
METLKELVSVINLQKIRQIKLITEDTDDPDKIKELYDLIATSQVESDEDAMRILYNNGSPKSYSRMKNRLKDRLINTLFFIDINQYSKTKYEVALHKIKRNYAVIGILLDRIKRTAAVELGEKTIKLAIKYEEVETVLSLSKLLRKHFTVYAYDKKKKKYYSQLMNNYLKYYQQEIQAEELYIDLANAILQNKNIEGYIKNNAHNIHEVVQNQKTNKNYFFNFYAYDALYFIILNERNYQKLLNLTDEAIEFFKNKEGFSKVALFGYNFKKGYTQLNLGYITEALKTFEVCKEMGPTPGSISWFNIHAYICMTAIILEKYDYALETLSKVTSFKHFNKLNKSLKEPWLVKEAYLNFLIKMKKVDPNSHKLKSFKIGKFLNEVPTYSKDKSGYNIAIIIIQLLYFLLDRKFSKFIDRIDALNQYSYRYLRNDDTLRSNCFIKMMLKIPDHNFHPVAVKRHTKKLKATLNNTKPDIREHSSHIEIIPYETLWELVLELLEKQKGG